MSGYAKLPPAPSKNTQPPVQQSSDSQYISIPHMQYQQSAAQQQHQPQQLQQALAPIPQYSQYNQLPSFNNTDQSFTPLILPKTPPKNTLKLSGKMQLPPQQLQQPTNPPNSPPPNIPTSPPQTKQFQSTGKSPITKLQLPPSKNRPPMHRTQSEATFSVTRSTSAGALSVDNQRNSTGNTQSNSFIMSESKGNLTYEELLQRVAQLEEEVARLQHDNQRLRDDNLRLRQDSFDSSLKQSDNFGMKKSDSFVGVKRSDSFGMKQSTSYEGLSQPSSADSLPRPLHQSSSRDEFGGQGMPLGLGLRPYTKSPSLPHSSSPGPSHLFKLPDLTDEKQQQPQQDLERATLDELIQHIYTSQSNIEFMKIVLMTYRAYTNGQELMSVMRAHYQRLNEKPPRLRLVNILKKWLDDHYHDFQNDQLLVQSFHEFVDQDIQPTEPQMAHILKEKFFSRESDEERNSARYGMKAFDGNAPRPIMPAKSARNFLDYNSLELARQLTLLEFHYYAAIQPKECLELAWTKKDKHERSPNLLHYIDRFNLLSNYVARTICSEKKLKERAKIIGKWIEVGVECRKLNNFNGVFEILSGLGNASVNRLRKTWEGVSKSKSSELESLRLVTSPDKSWKGYRAAISEAHSGPALPFVGVFQGDLTFVEEGNRTIYDDGRINVTKSRLIAQRIQELLSHQKTPYNLQPEMQTKNFLVNPDIQQPLTDDQLFEMSLEIEPRQG